MKIYDTMTRYKEEFRTIEPGKVRMYVCGPTVYNLIHIGNARPMIFFDTVRRYLEYKGYEVNFVSNFTDVDDKIIKAANEEGVDASVISERYIAECKKDMAGMNVRPASYNPRATEEISGMIDMIQKLIDGGHAYVAADGTVYYRVESFPDYGKLSTKMSRRTRRDFAPSRCAARRPRRIRTTLCSGSRRRKASPTGSRPGARAARAGTSSARS